MDEATLQAIEERANKATPGKWTVENHPNDYAVVAPHPVEPSITYIAFIDGGLSNDSKYDTEFIAYAREDVPALIAEVRRLKSYGDMYRSIAEVRQIERDNLRAKLDAVPVRGIAYLMADIVPVDGFDEADLHEARAAVVAWLESLGAEVDEVQP